MVLLLQVPDEHTEGCGHANRLDAKEHLPDLTDREPISSGTVPEIRLPPNVLCTRSRAPLIFARASSPAFMWLLGAQFFGHDGRAYLGGYGARDRVICQLELVDAQEADLRGEGAGDA